MLPHHGAHQEGADNVSLVWSIGGIAFKGSTSKMLHHVYNLAFWGM